MKTTREFEPALLGWGLLTAWGLVSLALEVPPIPGGPAVANAVTSAASLAGLGLLAVLIRLKPRLLDGTVRCPGVLVWGLGLFMAVCSLGDQVLQSPGMALVPAAVALQVLASFAYVVLMALWFVSYARRDPQAVESAAIWSTVLCAVVVALVRLLPYGASVAIWSLLPLVSVRCLVRISAPGGASPARISSDTAGSDQAPVRTFAGIAACGLVLALPSNLSPIVAIADRSSLLLGSLGGVFLAAVLVLGYTVSTRHIGLRSLFGWLQPVAVAGLFCAAVPLAPAAVAGVILASAGQWALYVFAWIYSAESPCRRSEKALGIYMGARAAFDVGNCLAALLGWGFVGVVGLPLARDLLVYLLFGAAMLFVLVGSLGIPLGPAAKEAVEGLSMRSGHEHTFDDLINERALAVAGRYGLSERETQILTRLLRGHSTAAVRNELGIAKGTVDTYISRVYRKCSVHSRQELVELAEGMAGPSRPV